MAFLDNSGDIILDAVLTDTGRYRLAKGDGSFKISKFALSDDEIDYSLYKPSHASGSAYYDLTVLQTPVFEAFTNNTSVQKSFLISISRTNLLYLPVIKQNTIYTSDVADHSSGYYIVSVDADTENQLATITTDNTVQNGIMFGENIEKGTVIRVDQGIDNTAVPATLALDPDLKETQYIVQLDHRLGVLCNPDSGTPATPSFIDDDFIASYYFSLGTDTSHVQSINDTTSTGMVIAGTRGTLFRTKIQSSLELNTSTYLFTKLGAQTTITGKDNDTKTIHAIDTTLRVQGATTGYVIDLPVRFTKYISG
jgi:hypothetical protein|tara:strand:- start:2606 stop:3535 length:930 start_codon:yes stop_codon:yes gene_type:complete